MTDEELLVQTRAVSAAIHAHYLSQRGKTEEGWVEVLKDPRKYNLTWRHMLKHACGQHDLPISSFPPPIHLQALIPSPKHDATK